MPRYIIAKTNLDYIDTAFEITSNNQITPIKHKVFYDLEGLVRLNVTLQYSLPKELSLEILLYVAMDRLRNFYFDDVYELLQQSKGLIHKMYYIMFGTSELYARCKLFRLYRILRICKMLYGNYFIQKAQYCNPTVVFHPFHNEAIVYPWDIHELSVISLLVDNNHPVFTLGMNYSDLLMMYEGSCEDGVWECPQISFPMIQCAVISRAKTIPIHKLPPQPKYFFQRLSFILEQVYSKPYFCSEKPWLAESPELLDVEVPLEQQSVLRAFRNFQTPIEELVEDEDSILLGTENSFTEENESLAEVFLSGYCFTPLPYCMLK